MHEEILEFIETADREALCITLDKIIVVKLGGLLGDWSDMEAGSFLGIIGSKIESNRRADKKEKLGKLSPESILTADTENYAIPCSEIIKAEISKGFLGPKIKITAGINKHQFKLKNNNEYDKCMHALKPVLGDRLTVS